MTEKCAICGCELHRTKETYARPTAEGRSHASKHHFVPERFFGRSAMRKGEQRKKIFEVTLWFMFVAGAYGSNKSEQRKQLEEIANEVNASAPIRISNELVLTRIIVRDYDELAYVFHNLVYKAYQINRSIFPQLKAQTERGVCSKPDTRRLLEEFGVSLSYVYYDKENTYVGEFTIKPRDCGL